MSRPQMRGDVGIGQMDPPFLMCTWPPFNPDSCLPQATHVCPAPLLLCLLCLQASFGPFYRITQLILTTTPAANSTATTPSGLPAIVTGGVVGLWCCPVGPLASRCQLKCWRGDAGGNTPEAASPLMPAHAGLLSLVFSTRGCHSHVCGPHSALYTSPVANHLTSSIPPTTRVHPRLQMSTSACFLTCKIRWMCWWPVGPLRALQATAGRSAAAAAVPTVVPQMAAVPAVPTAAAAAGAAGT